MAASGVSFGSMAKQDYSRHQQGIINRYYDHSDTIHSTKLQEIVSELYLADSEKKIASLWKRAGQALAKMKVEQAEIDQLLAAQDVAQLAKVVGQADAGRARGQSR